jgi:FtsP/CotA-like multicopper oxidase with cupredoxin domain
LVIGVVGTLASAASQDELEGLPPANRGAFEGGPTGSVEDTRLEFAIEEEDLRSGGSFDIPTGFEPSPLFGARSFTQKLLLFEEFGLEPLPGAFRVGQSFPLPTSVSSGPLGTALDAFLGQEIFPAPTAFANVLDENPWREVIERFLGRALVTAPAEGRPPGSGWAHQRWSEFPPRVYFQSAQAGARTNGGLRDRSQRHRYELGEFGPAGLYHDTAGAPGFGGTTRGIEIRLHPNMPVQHPNSVWTFDGTLPPKLLLARYGEAVLFRHYNALPIDPSANMGFGLHTISTHEHNGHNPAESDGYTNAFFFPGQYFDYRWPMIAAGHDSINPTASDPRMGTPDGSGGIRRLKGDWRELASTHWFHDHMLDYTAQNVYKGNAAMMNYYSSVDRGNEAIADGVNLRLPSGTALDWGNRDYDVNLVIADKAWFEDGQLAFNIFNVDGFLGDRLTTNWQFHPYLDVRARRYRFRILNGSVSRYLKLALVDQQNRPVPFHLVANDGNLMEHAVAFDGTRGTTAGVLPTQSIAERYDIVVDFSRFRPGDRLYFVNLMEHKDGRRPERAVPLADVLAGRYRAQPSDEDGDGAPERWINGDPCVGKFLEFRVHAYAGTDRSMNPADYAAGRRKMIPLARPSSAELANARHRTFVFGKSSGTDEAPWTIKTDGGSGFTMDPRRVSAAPELGSLEVWHFVNGGGGWSHPVHVHFEEGLILSRGGNPPPEWERWARKDMFRIGPEPESTSSVEVALRVRDFAGTYVEHCHNTQHEDHAMLLRWDVERPGQVTYLPAPIPSWDGIEYVPSVALPTARTGDGFGPSED